MIPNEVEVAQFKSNPCDAANADEHGPKGKAPKRIRGKNPAGHEVNSLVTVIVSYEHDGELLKARIDRIIADCFKSSDRV